MQELAKEWNLSSDKIRQIFRNEPGVVKLRDKDATKKRKRNYVSLRIPREVAARVKQRYRTEAFFSRLTNSRRFHRGELLGTSSLVC